MRSFFKSYVCIKQHDSRDCAAACLATITKQYGFKISIAKIREYAGTDIQGTNAIGIIKAAEKLGFTAKGVEGDSESFYCKFPLPAIAHVITEQMLLHYVVIHYVNKDKIIVADPAKEINPTIGCQFQCQYCNAYTQEEETYFNKVIVYKDYPEYFEDYIIKNKDCLKNKFFYFSPKSDCLQDCLIDSGVTRSILEICRKYDINYFLLTKGKVPPKEIQEILIDSKDINQVIISFAMPNDAIRKNLEPNTPTVEERLDFAKFCSDNNIFTTIIFSPILPIGNLEYIKEYISYFVSIGINHYHLDFLQLSRDSYKKIIQILPQYKEEWEKLYFSSDAEFINWKVPFKEIEMYRYRPPVLYMKEAFSSLAEYVSSIDENATISTCNSLIAQENMPNLNSKAKKRGICCIGARF